jgi:hypothetical protein
MFSLTWCVGIVEISLAHVFVVIELGRRRLLPGKKLWTRQP